MDAVRRKSIPEGGPYMIQDHDHMSGTGQMGGEKGRGGARQSEQSHGDSRQQGGQHHDSGQQGGERKRRGRQFL